MNNIKMIGYAIIQIFTGLITLLSLGFIISDAPMMYLTWLENREYQREIKKMKEDENEYED